MTPDQLAASGTESGHQRAVFCWAAYPQQVRRFPMLARLMFHIPNGGSRGDNARSRAIRGNALKAEGVKPGVADILLAFPRHGYCGLYIEMKKPGKKPTAEQLEFKELAQAEGYGWICCDNWKDAVDNIERYCTHEQTNNATGSVRGAA